ncbi:MAG: hypothetical protein U9N46_00525 [Euryarchaeota archaeon]|nr:hypothetical protein [Euryarchaeota archaeon]
MTSGYSGLDVYVNVGPALEDAHIQEMKRLESITSSFETMNEMVFLNGGRYTMPERLRRFSRQRISGRSMV